MGCELNSSDFWVANSSAKRTTEKMMGISRWSSHGISVSDGLSVGQKQTYSNIWIYYRCCNASKHVQSENGKDDADEDDDDMDNNKDL